MCFAFLSNMNCSFPTHSEMLKYVHAIVLSTSIIRSDDRPGSRPTHVIGIEANTNWVALGISIRLKFDSFQ